jgi:uncharacterized membrane protein YidH (DUF202 family)
LDKLMGIKRINTSAPSTSSVTKAFGSPNRKSKTDTDIKVQKINPWILVSIISFAIASALTAHFTAKALGNTMDVPGFPFNGAIIIGAGINFIGVAIANEVHNRKCKMKALEKGEEFPKTVNTLHLLAVNLLAVTVALGAYYIAKKTGAPTQIPDAPLPWAVLLAGLVNITGVVLLNQTHHRRERERKLKALEETKHKNPIYCGL